jgi:glycosyltransferase involved in cell wall biosynthesis
MNILMLGRWVGAPRYPLKATREYHFGRVLAQKHSLTLAFTTDNPNAVGPISSLRSEFGDLEFTVMPRTWKSLASAVSLMTGESCTLSYFRSEALRSRLADRIRATPYDLVFVTSSSMIQYAMEIDPAIPVIVDFAHVDSEWWIRQASRGSFPGSRFFQTEGVRLRATEALAARRAAHCLVATPEAAKLVQGFKPTGPVTVVADGVDVENFRSRPRRGGPPTVVLATALGGASESHDALEFIRQVMPAVRSQYPEVRLVISSHESPRDAALTYRIPGVEVDAPRPDMRPALARASVAVAPLWTSDNVRQTVLQPMGGGIPVVVTSQAAQALGAEAGRDLLVADAPREFANQILHLLRDHEAATDMGARGQLLVSTKYAWSVLTVPVHGLVESVAKMGPPPPAPKPLAGLRGSR